MENTDLLKSQLEVDSVAANYLSETAKWGKFLAIVGFVFTAIIILAGLFFTVAISSMGGYYGSVFAGLGPVIGIFYIAIGAIYLYPCLCLYRFSTKMKAALLVSDQETLNEAFNQHRKMYKFFGIITIIVLGLYALIFIFGGLAAIFR